jgi:aminopeptidase-like protein
MENPGKEMHELMKKLFPICRSLTGNGVRETLNIIKGHIPITMHEVPSGTKAFDWTVGKEWNIQDAYVLDPQGQKILDFKRNNLHVMGYSVPINKMVFLEELQEHLYSLPEQPDAIPYVFSYYKEAWGFCMADRQRQKLKAGQYRVVIDSTLSDGHLTYAECIIPGKTDREIFISSYVCHPSMANNELSGPVVLTYLTKWIMSQPRHFTYRVILVPETIGALVYLSRHLKTLKKKVEVGFNLSCIGDERAHSYVASPYGNNAADRIAQNVLKYIEAPVKKVHSFLERGSDERQYCSPGVDLPVVTLCRSKFGEFKEYHTSLDDLDFVTPAGLAGGYDFARQCVETAEMNRYYLVTCLGEPQLGKRGLYSSIGGIDGKKSDDPEFDTRDLINFITYANGANDLIAISNIIGVPVNLLNVMAMRLLKEGLLREVKKDEIQRK